MSNRKLIERLHRKITHIRDISDVSHDVAVLIDFLDLEQAANALQALEWNTDMEAAPKKARTIELLPESGEVILVSGGAWVRISTPEEYQ